MRLSKIDKTPSFTALSFSKPLAEPQTAEYRKTFGLAYATTKCAEEEEPKKEPHNTTTIREPVTVITMNTTELKQQRPQTAFTTTKGNNNANETETLSSARPNSSKSSIRVKIYNNVIDKPLCLREIEEKVKEKQIKKKKVTKKKRRKITMLRMMKNPYEEAYKNPYEEAYRNPYEEINKNPVAWKRVDPTTATLKRKKKLKRVRLKSKNITAELGATKAAVATYLYNTINII